MDDRCCEKSQVQKMFLLSVIVMIEFFTSDAAELTAVVNTTYGPVQGAILTTINLKTYAAFKGIPYAEPPIGLQRFKPPVPVDPWTSTLNATAEGPPCPQFNPFTNIWSGLEDCLFLNIFTPVMNLTVTPRVLKSVMVWIHGGAFVIGSGSTKDVQPDYLLEKDVVVVTLNYRLGALGFLNLNHPNATGNAGLKDQTLALKWVQKNIEKFGGNPKNVTIFGVSAGGASVGFHVLSESSAGLFHGAISMSGAPLGHWAIQTTEKAVSIGEQLGKLLGTTSTSKETLLETFYNATSTQIIDATLKIGLLISFTPTIENASITTEPFITESPYRKYYTGNYNKVPQILGYMDQETTGFTISMPVFLEIIENEITEAVIDGIEPPESLVIIKNVILAGGNLSQVDPNIVQAAINISSALLFISPADSTQKLLATDNNKSPVFYYHISFFTDRSLHSMNFPDAIQGAAHGDDTAYIFYIPRVNCSTDPNDPTARTIHRVSTMWTNFAKYGNPTPDWVNDSSVGVIWPDSGPCGYVLDIGDELVVGSRSINDETALIELLSWSAEKKSLGIPQLIRPIQRVYGTVPRIMEIFFSYFNRFWSYLITE